MVGNPSWPRKCAHMAETISSAAPNAGIQNTRVVRDGRLVTPPLSSGCLAGVTRELLLELTGAVEADVPIAALTAADEAFLTSSTREVQPIRSVDGVVLSAVPGATTTAALTALRDLVARDIDP